MPAVLNGDLGRESEPSVIDRVRIWARHLAAETYGQFAALYYVCPERVAALAGDGRVEWACRTSRITGSG